MLMYNEYMEKFSIDNNFVLPNNRYHAKKYYISNLKTYMKSYTTMYGKTLYFEDKHIENIKLLQEAYIDTFKHFEDYLTLKKNIFIGVWFSINIAKVKRFFKLAPKYIYNSRIIQKYIHNK